MSHENKLGEILRIQVVIGLSLVLGTVVAGATWLHYAYPNHRGTLEFFVGATATAAGILGAYYVGKGLRRSIQQQEIANHDRGVTDALKFATRWNDPGSTTQRKQWRGLIKKARAIDARPERIAVFCSAHETETLTYDVLNFFETMGLAVRREAADIATIEHFFGSVIEEYWDAVEPYVRKVRSDDRNPRIYDQTEWLVRACRKRIGG